MHAAAEIKNHKKKETNWYVAILGALTTTISAATAAQFSATLAPLAAKLGVTEAAVAMTESVKSVVVVFAMLAAPTLIARKGWRLTFILGALAVLVPQVWMPLTHSYTVLVLLKGLQGISALLFPLILILVMEWTSEENMGLATSIFTGVFYAGGAGGGAVAGFCIARWGWESSYHVLSAALTVMGLIFLCTVKSERNNGSAQVEKSEDNCDYWFVVKHKLTWLLVVSFLPTVWTIQAIWADMVPFGLGLGYTEAESGGVTAFSAAAIVVAALLSGKASDFFAARTRRRLTGRIAVFSAGMFMIVLSICFLLLKDIAPPALPTFNAYALCLSFGAAWGLRSFYCIFPELFTEKQAAAANGFIGGIADMAMPLSPIVMALLGIRMGLWRAAWLSCAVVAFIGLFAAFQIYRAENK